MLICNSWKCLVEIHHATSLTYHMIVRCFQNMNTFVVIRLIGPQSEGKKKKKRKRDQCRNQISMSCSSFQKAKLLAASSSSQAVAQHGILASWASYGEILQIITFDKEWRQILASSPDFGFWRHVTNSKLKEMIDVWLKWEKEKEVKQPAFS